MKIKINKKNNNIQKNQIKLNKYKIQNKKIHRCNNFCKYQKVI